jgi:hypothetical protein
VTDSYDSETPVTYLSQEKQEKFQTEYTESILEKILQEKFS